MVSAAQDRLQAAKTCVRSYIGAFDAAAAGAAQLDILEQYTARDYLWRGVHPFNDLTNAGLVIDHCWAPLRQSFLHLQRRMDLFFAGDNDGKGAAGPWVVNAGHLMGRFVDDFLGIPATGRIATIRYAEFHHVGDGRISESMLMLDLLSLMHQAGVYPLPAMTAAPQPVAPGPRTQDGLLFEPCPPEAGQATLALVNRMVARLVAFTEKGHDAPSRGDMALDWHHDMAWYGPVGIGSTLGIEAFQEQHQFPFRQGLGEKHHVGHVARFAEGYYGAFFGWPSLTNRNAGGFLGLPIAAEPAPMRVVDLYRRDGDKLAENWVMIDFLHYLKAQGLDVLARIHQVR